MLELPNGIVQGVSTRAEIIAAYGEPDYLDSWGKYVRYDMEGFEITIVVGPEENDILGMISIRYKDWLDFERASF